MVLFFIIIKSDTENEKKRKVEATKICCIICSFPYKKKKRQK